MDSVQLNYRLPNTLHPLEYKVKLQPNLIEDSIIDKKWTAPGEVIIRIYCNASTKNICLHKGKKTEIMKESIQLIRESTSKYISIKNVHFCPQTEILTLELEKCLKRENIYKIWIPFISSINDKRCIGLYASKVDSKEDEEDYLVATQFEPFHARKAFPCFDELSFKAKFQLSIGRRKDYFALSNTPTKSTSQDKTHKGWIWEHFEKTEIMSPSLLAFLILKCSKVDFVEVKRDKNPVNPVSIKLFGHKSDFNKEDGRLQVNFIAKCLNFYTRYFNKKYTLKKYDSAFVCGFYTDAMENWGLTFYSSCLFGRVKELQSAKIDRAILISHEIAHQWYGNLVTPSWWTQLWLKEGFATYLSYIACNDLEAMTSEKNSFSKYFQKDIIQYALKLETSQEKKQHPLLLPDDEMNKILSVAFIHLDKHVNMDLVYKKGAAIIKMMEGFLTTKTLTKAMRMVLAEFEFKVIDQSQLLRVFEREAYHHQKLRFSKSLSQIMENWTTKCGFPLVVVKSLPEYNKIKISQRPFIKSYGDPEVFWEVPIAIETSKNRKFEERLPEVWLPSDGTSVKYKHDCSTWIILNARATGYYRVIYDKSLTQNLVAQLMEDHLVIPPNTRSQIIDDYFSSAYASFTSITLALDLTKYLGEETEFIVWNAVLGHFEKIWNLADENESEKIKAYLFTRIIRAFEVIGIEENTERDTRTVLLQRALLFRWACKIGYTKCIVYVNQLFNKWRSSSSKTDPVPVDLQASVYCIGVENDNDNIKFLQKWSKEQDDSRSNFQMLQNIAVALGYSQKMSTLRRLMKKTLTIQPDARLSKKTRALATAEQIARNPKGRNMIFNFIVCEFQSIMKSYPDGSAIGRVIGALSRHYSTKEERKKVRNFINENAESFKKDVLDSLHSSVEQIKSNILWKRRFMRSIVQWMEMN